jgi:hypothetical protein
VGEVRRAGLASALVLALAVLVRAAGATTYPPPASGFVPISPGDQELSRFFHDHVRRDGRMRYDLVRTRSRRGLDSLITDLAMRDTAGWRPSHRMALQIDLYNLVMIRAVVDRWKPGWTPAADGFAVFKAPLVPTRAGRISLDALEKQRTIPVFRDPRAHIAFNCAAVSCPPLAEHSWLAHREALHEELEAGMKSFVRDTARNQVDHARRVLRLSRIFDWYAADFGGRAGLLRIVSRYLGRDVSGYRVEFLDYDWSLNAATYPDGSNPR